MASSQKNPLQRLTHHPHPQTKLKLLSEGKTKMEKKKFLTSNIYGISATKFSDKKLENWGLEGKGLIERKQKEAVVFKQGSECTYFWSLM